jgi:hypothetical protein
MQIQLDHIAGREGVVRQVGEEELVVLAFFDFLFA